MMGSVFYTYDEESKKGEGRKSFSHTKSLVRSINEPNQFIKEPITPTLYNIQTSYPTSTGFNLHTNKNWKEWCDEIEKYVGELDFEYKKILNTEWFNKKLCVFDIENYQKFFSVLEQYKADKEKNDFFLDISKESEECFLLILPILACRNIIDIHIDSSNGNINIDISQNINEILNIQVASNRLIYFSYVGRNNRIFKITGAMKLKNKFDLIEVHRICNLL